MATLIVYGTIEGQTGKIAAFVKDIAEQAGQEVVLFNTGDRTSDVSFADVDRAILAGSVHERRHPKPFEVFLDAHRTELERLKTLLLSVSLSAAFPEGEAEAQDYVDEMKMRTGLDPDAELLVAGAVRTDRYDFYATQVLRHVVLKGRDFDASQTSHEFTDWTVLQAGVREFLAA